MVWFVQEVKRLTTGVVSFLWFANWLIFSSSEQLLNVCWKLQMKLLSKEYAYFSPLEGRAFHSWDGEG